MRELHSSQSSVLIIKGWAMLLPIIVASYDERLVALGTGESGIRAMAHDQPLSERE